MIDDLTELTTLDDVIKVVSRNLNLPNKIIKHLEEWGSYPNLLKEGVPSTFRRTFEMEPSDTILSELKLGQRVGERTKLKKIKNLIIGWLAEEIASGVLRNNNSVKTVEPSGIDVERTIELTRTPTDPDYRVLLKNNKILFIEVVSIGKIGDGKIRLKYNKVKRNLMKYFGLSKGRSAHWREHFLNPCVYFCVDLISTNVGGFIVEGPDLYVTQFPNRYPGWENQEVVMFDTQKRLNFIELSNYNLQRLRETLTVELNKEFARLHRAVGILGNPLLIDSGRERYIKKFLRKLFELDHTVSIRKRRDKTEAKQISKMKRELIETFKEIPIDYQRRLSSFINLNTHPS